jgi:hypothetical protein
MADFQVSHRPEDAGIAQLVERNLAKVEVAGSNPVSRSNIKAPLVSTSGAFLLSANSLLKIRFSR